METEIWKSVVGWEDLYEVSNFGNVRTLHYKKPYLMHPVLDAKGYRRVSFTRVNSKKYKRFAVHRLVAQAFIPNPDNLPEVNHKDENRQNNRVDNLEWCTNKYNCNYGNFKQKVSDSRIGIKFSEIHLDNLRRSHVKVQGKPVLQCDRNGVILNEFDSMSDASRSLGISVVSISHCCRKISKSAGGYVFKYKDI